MRPRIVLLVLTLAVLALLPLLLVWPPPLVRSRPQMPAPTPSEARPGQAESSRAGANPTPALHAPRPGAPSAQPASTTPPAQEALDSVAAQHRAEVEARVVELGDLGMQDNANAFDRIVAALSDPEPEVRQAAVEATIQFGSSEAIPKLQQAATQTRDPREKAAIAQAIEFLKLPTVSEFLAERKAAPRQPALPKPGPSR